MKHRLAVFDIDGTIFRSSLVIELVNTLVRRKNVVYDIKDFDFEPTS